MTTLIKNALVLTMDDDFTEYANADILVEGTKISAIGKNLSLPDGSQDGRVTVLLVE
jgi:dihydroorotase-like cyclic amidohydrolase